MLLLPFDLTKRVFGVNSILEELTAAAELIEKSLRFRSKDQWILWINAKDAKGSL